MLHAGLLAAILLLAAGLRLHDLGAESLWVDEGASLRFAGMGVGELLASVGTDPNPPAYYLLLHYWVALSGESEWSLRLPSALFGVLSVGAVWAVGRALLGRAAGLLAALILALSPFHVHYSQEARAFALVALLGLLSYYFFVRLSEGEAPTQGRPLLLGAGYALSTALLLWSHVYGAFVVLAQNAHVALLLVPALLGGGRGFGPRLLPWVALQLAVVALYAPLLVLMSGAFSTRRGRWWVQPPSPGSVGGSLVEYAGSPALLLVLGLFAVLGAAALLARREPGRLSLLVLWLAVPIAVPVAISAVATPMFATRYPIAATPALYLLAAGGIAAAGGALSRVYPRAPLGRAAVLGGALLVAALCAPQLARYYEETTRDDWRGAASYVESRARPGDAAFFAPGYAHGDVFSHYYGGGPPLRVQDGSRPHQQFRATRRLASRAVRGGEGRPRAERVWVVAWRDQANPGFYELVFRSLRYEPVATEGFEGVSVTLMERRPSSDRAPSVRSSDRSAGE
jgi:hypothetical protein